MRKRTILHESPTLYAWNPYLEKGDQVSSTLKLTLTPFASTNTVSADQKMCIQILNALGIDAQPIRWSCDPFRTSYYSAPDADSTDHWRVVWTMSIELNQSLERVPRLCDEYFEISEGGWYSTQPVEETLELECCIIADFQNLRDAEYACSEIQKIDSDLKFCVTALGDQFTQINVDIGCFPPEVFSDGRFERGKHFEDLIRANHGIPNFTEREETWDTFFDEGGIEPFLTFDF